MFKSIIHYPGSQDIVIQFEHPFTSNPTIEVSTKELCQAFWLPPSLATKISLTINNHKFSDLHYLLTFEHRGFKRELKSTEHMKKSDQDNNIFVYAHFSQAHVAAFLNAFTELDKAQAKREEHRLTREEQNFFWRDF